MLHHARESEELQAGLRAACAESCWFWINAFVWTFRQKITTVDGQELPVSGESTHWPFVTWKVQDEFIGELIDAIDTGHDVDIKKSRDMGASWLSLTVFHWYWAFKRNVTFLELSRKEDLVYDRNNLDALFQKHLYILEWTPAWMRPRFRDTYMQLDNLDTGSSILGESTNGDAGRGGRKTGVLVDEAPAVKNLAEIDAATSQTTSCRIFNGTSKGPGTHAYKRIQAGMGRFLEMPWYRHPEKGVGARQYIAADGKVKWTNAWHQGQAKKMSKKALAQEIDMDDGMAGDMFFDRDSVEQHRISHESAPLLTGDVRTRGDLSDETKKDLIRKQRHVEIALFRATPRQSWRFWLPPIDGRPAQEYTYVFGVDISNGAGDSNSVITVVAHEIGQVVAKFWDSNVLPEELAEIAAFAGVWFGGVSGPALVVWENNGPGGIFGRKIIKMGYQNCYFQRNEGTSGEKRTLKWGWHSTQERKTVLLGRYRESLEKGHTINPCTESLDEALEYITDPNGLPIPARLLEEPGGGRALHGDHVIADALTVLGRDELQRLRESRMRPPAGSFAARRESFKKSQKAHREWDK